MNTFDVCVVGAGPAGSVAAGKLVRNGQDVCLVEKATFPRPQIGESLPPSVLPMLEQLGLRARVEEAGFARPTYSEVHWETDSPVHRPYPAEPGLQVDRGIFDTLLLEYAAGATLKQPARIRSISGDRYEWKVRLENETIHARFLVDATGRKSRLLPGPWNDRSAPTIALHAYWNYTSFPDHATHIDSSPEGWFWAAPLADGRVNMAAFADPRRVKSGGIEATYKALLASAPLMAPGLEGDMITAVQACDASSMIRREVIGANWIRIGDAALTVDPLSSQGVQIAMRTGFQGAAAVHTMLIRADSSAVAQKFYRDRIKETFERHRRMSQELYSRHRRFVGALFWECRAIADETPSATPELFQPEFNGSWQLSPEASIQQVPVLTKDLIEEAPALIHPNLERPVAFLSGVPVRYLLAPLDRSRTWPEISYIWSALLPLKLHNDVATWLQRNQIVTRR